MHATPEIGLPLGPFKYQMLQASSKQSGRAESAHDRVHQYENG